MNKLYLSNIDKAEEKEYFHAKLEKTLAEERERKRKVGGLFCAFSGSMEILQFYAICKVYFVDIHIKMGIFNLENSSSQYITSHQ